MAKIFVKETKKLKKCRFCSFMWSIFLFINNLYNLFGVSMRIFYLSWGFVYLNHYSKNNPYTVTLSYKNIFKYLTN